MKSLDVCDSTQNDDEKEPGKGGKRQEKKENGKENVNESVNGGNEKKGSDILKKSKSDGEGNKSEAVGMECLEKRAESNVNERDGDNNGNVKGSNGESDETTPTSTDEGTLNVSEGEVICGETICGEEFLDTCQVVSDTVSCSKETDENVEIEELNFLNLKQLQELKSEPMDVDSASAGEDPYRNVKSIIETHDFMEGIKDEENFNDIDDDDVHDEGGLVIEEDTILDPDCDKENEKNVEDGKVNGFSKAGRDDTRVSLESSSSECEIRVGECQTISGSDNDFLWNANESKKSQELENHSVSQALDESDNIPRFNSEENRENEGNKFPGEDGVMAETDEKHEKGDKSSTTESGSDKRRKEDLDKSCAKKAESVCEDGNCSPTSEQEESVSGRKRKKSNEIQSTVDLKKKRSECDDGRTSLVSEGKGANDSSPSTSSSSHVTELITIADDTNSKKSKASSEDIERLSTEETAASPFLASLRGTLKNMTRSDLEELIVQKLCEVITERSTVGELRRRAQALEEDQERWRTKVQSLHKQMREMEMVMKKYMAEVQKQVKDKPSHMVTPIKVTRSVGLQVSFYATTSKMPKPGFTTTPNLVQAPNTKNAKAVPAKLLPTFTSVPSPRNKSSLSPPKSTPQPPKSPVTQAKKTVTTRSDSGALPPKVTPSVMTANRVGPSQLSGPGIKINYKAPSTVQLTNQNGSKVIDLTDDDDKQPGSVAKPQSPIRVVNHLSPPQPQIQTSGRFAYYLPKTSTQATGTSSGQNRPVLIAAPTVTQQNRPVMCPMPPLLFKGGSVPAPPAQAPTTNNRAILPKALRHPAPLPQAPPPPVTRKNMKLLPPRPALKISKVQTGIVLSWNMTLGPEHAPIASYQLYAYQESNSPPTTSLWKKVGDVKALPLPMACTLTQFMSGHKYHFAVRAVDHHCRLGPFSFPGTIVLVK